ncbi:MAG: sugar phosphate nucleotidyltransferase [Anaerolineae bacterium]|jgi:glucose-1-phosphate thymidylyltransferase
MYVVIPVAGFGTRLRPHTYTKPKPLVNVAGKPVLGHILDRLAGLDIDRIIFVVGYLGDQIRDYVESNYNLPTRYVEQKELLGQAHAIGLTRPYVEGPVLIAFVDTIFEGDLSDLDHIRSDGAIYVKEVEDPRRFGVVTVADGQIRRFVEKPSQPVSNLAVIGLYYIKPYGLLFDCINELQRRNLRTEGEFYLADALQLMVDRGTRLEPRTVDVWKDCGTAEALLDTNRYLLENDSHNDVRPAGSIVRPPVFISPDAQIEDSIIGPYVYIGPGCRVKGSVIGPYVSMAPGATVEQAILRDSIVNEDAHIDCALLSESLVGQHALVRGGFERLNVGDSSEIESRGLIL